MVDSQVFQMMSVPRASYVRFGAPEAKAGRTRGNGVVRNLISGEPNPTDGQTVTLSVQRA